MSVSGEAATASRTRDRLFSGEAPLGRVDPDLAPLCVPSWVFSRQPDTRGREEKISLGQKTQ